MSLLATFIFQFFLFSGTLQFIDDSLRKRISDPSTRAATAFVCSGVFAYLIFWIYFFSPLLGYLSTAIVCGLSLFSLSRIWRKKRIFVDETALFLFLGGVFYILLYLSKADSHEAIATNMTRLFRGSTTDNIIPFILANRMREGNHDPILVVDWLLSDRTPLQSGFYLGLSFLKDLTWYWSFAIVLQLQIFRGWDFLLETLQIEKRFRRASAWMLLFSPFVAMNVMNVWPKMLAGALFLIALAFFIRSQKKLFYAVGAGTAAALAYLSHGGVFFALPIFAVLGSLKTARSFFIRTSLCAALGLCFMIPWQLFVRRVAPPGDRLLKYHLAGQREINPDGALTAIRKAYSDLSWSDWLQTRQRNLAALWGEWVPGQFWQQLWSGSFFFLAFNLVILGWGLVAWRRYPRSEPSISRLSLGLTLGFAFWNLAMFTPGSTILHHGSYAANVLILGFCAIGISALPRSLSRALMIAQAAIFVAAYFWGA